MAKAFKLSLLLAAFLAAFSHSAVRTDPQRGIIVDRESEKDRTWPNGTLVYVVESNKNYRLYNRVFTEFSMGSGTFGGFGDPTATIGLTVVPGSDTLAMRRDGAPALSQDIAPVWTSPHTFDSSAVFPDARSACVGTGAIDGSGGEVTGDSTDLSLIHRGSGGEGEAYININGGSSFVQVSTLAGSGTRYVTASADGTLGTGDPSGVFVPTTRNSDVCR